MIVVKARAPNMTAHCQLRFWYLSKKAHTGLIWGLHDLWLELQKQSSLNNADAYSQDDCKRTGALRISNGFHHQVGKEDVNFVDVSKHQALCG